MRCNSVLCLSVCMVVAANALTTRDITKGTCKNNPGELTIGINKGGCSFWRHYCDDDTHGKQIQAHCPKSCLICADYQVVWTGDACPAGTTITTKAECEKAAMDLRAQTGKTDITASYSATSTSRTRPKGCGYGDYGYILYFYPQATGKCGDIGMFCLCQAAPDSPITTTAPTSKSTDPAPVEYVFTAAKCDTTDYTISEGGTRVDKIGADSWTGGCIATSSSLSSSSLSSSSSSSAAGLRGVGPYYVVFERTASKYFEEISRGTWMFGFCLSTVDPHHNWGKFWVQQGTWMVGNGDGYWETAVHGLQTTITSSVADSPNLGEDTRVGLLLHNATLSIVRGGRVVGDKVITGIPLDKPLLPCVHMHQSKQAVRLHTNLSVPASLLEHNMTKTVIAAETTSTVTFTSSLQDVTTTTTDPAYADYRYRIVRAAASCAHAGAITITTKAECERAAVALRVQTKKFDMTAEESSFHTNFRPKGCGYSEYNSELEFNPLATGECNRIGFEYTCLCKVDTDSPTTTTITTTTSRWVAITANLDDSDDDDDSESDNSCNLRCTIAALIPVVMPIVSLITLVASVLGCIYCCKKTGSCCFRKPQIHVTAFRAQPDRFSSRQLVTATVAPAPVHPVFATDTAKGAIAGETTYPTVVANVDAYPAMDVGNAAPAVVANPMPVAFGTPIATADIMPGTVVIGHGTT